MRKVLVLLALGLFMSTVAKAQMTEQEMSLMGSILKSEVKVFFAQNMQLATTETEAFWATYDEYNEALQPISNQRITLLKDVIEKDGELTEEELDVKINALNKFTKQRQALRMKYYKIFKKRLGIKVAAQFYQIDGYIYTHVSASLNESLPIIVPKKK